MTINTDADVIRVIRENPRLVVEAITASPELLAEVRRVVLTDELLAMPEQLAEVVKSLAETRETLSEVVKTQNEMLKVQDETLKSLAETRETLSEVVKTQNEMLKVQDETLKSLAETRETLSEVVKTQNKMLKVQDETLKSLAETRETLSEVVKTQNKMLKVQDETLKSLVETRETQSEMLKTQEEMLRVQREMLKEQANVRRDITALHGMYRREHEDFGRFRGAYAIDATRRNAGDIALLFSRSRAHGFRRVSMMDFTQADINDFLASNYDALDALGLRERAWNTFLKGDIIARVTEVMGDSPGFYLAVEASYTVDSEDVRRAIEHAKMLRCAGDMAAYAVVAGVRRNDSIELLVYKDVEDFIRAGDEDSALWFQLDLKGGRRLGALVSA